MGTVLVFIIQPWIRDHRHYLPGIRLMLPAEEYRRWRNTEYFERRFIPVYHPVAQRTYLHAVNGCGRPMSPSTYTPRPTAQEPVLARVYGPQDPIPLDELPRPPPRTVTRGCGCRGRR